MPMRPPSASETISRKSALRRKKMAYCKNSMSTPYIILKINAAEILYLYSHANCRCLRKATAHRNENTANTKACAKLSKRSSAHSDRSGKLLPGKPHKVLSTMVHKMANTECCSNTLLLIYYLLANQRAVICGR